MRARLRDRNGIERHAAAHATDLQTGTIEVLADSYDGKPFVGPNDVTIDGKGRLYFTDLQGAAVYRVDAPGRVTRLLAAPDIQRPNGHSDLRRMITRSISSRATRPRTARA